jgi:hypothetical protein
MGKTSDTVAKWPRSQSKRWVSAFLFSWALGHWATRPLLAVEVQPVVSAEILGGQYIYNGSDSSLGANTAVSASPYMKLNDRWSVVPLYQGSYQGTKQVTDFTGGGTTFQDSQDHTFSAKVIRSYENGLKLKAIGAYGIEWLRETKDEDWTKGLYDNKRASGGAEADWSWAKDQSVRLLYDYYAIDFPNYQSLESQVAAGDLGRELNQPDVLNNTNHSVTLDSQMEIPGHGLLQLTANTTWRSYAQQHIVVASGDLIADTRNDSIMTLSGQGTWPVWANESKKLFTSLGYSWTQLLSNQNDYDAPPAVFNPNYYAYHTQGVNNAWTLVMGEVKPLTLNFIGTLSRQQYSNRLTQDSTGAYGTDTTHVDYATIGFGAKYPIAKKFQLIGQIYAGWSDSNNTFTQQYQYHYNTSSIMMGFRYEY